MKKSLILLSLVSVLAFASCNKWLDINYSPNSPGADQVSNDMIFPAAEMAFSAKYGDLMRIVGGYFSEHYCHLYGTSNFLDFSQFTMSQTRSNTSYGTIMSACIANATVVRDNAIAAQEWGTALAATTIRVFAFQALADAYGEIPYTEAQLGDKNLAPHFDEGQVVYAGLVAELDEALSKATESDGVCQNFLFRGENSRSWVRFANALKLKLLMRERAADGISVDAALTTLVTENNFPASDVAWKGIWANESGKANPYYQEEFATYFGSTQTNVALNLALLKVMDESSDKRLQKFFNANKAGNYWGGVSGTNMSLSNTYKSDVFCRPNMAYDSPVYLITVSEVEFFLAEYYQKVKNDAVSAADHYQKAIEASFVSAGLTAADAASVLAAYPYSAANSDKYIGIQKWVALAGTNNYEAWCELRRMGYPEFGTTKGSDISDEKDTYTPAALTTGELYAPIKVDTDIADQSTSARWPYPQSASNYNKNCPAVKKANVKVFWAK